MNEENFNNNHNDNRQDCNSVPASSRRDLEFFFFTQQ